MSGNVTADPPFGTFGGLLEDDAPAGDLATMGDPSWPMLRSTAAAALTLASAKVERMVENFIFFFFLVKRGSAGIVLNEIKRNYAK